MTTRKNKGENLEFILDKLNDEYFKEHALLAVEYGVSLRKVLKFIGTTYQTVYSSNWTEETIPKHLKNPVPRFLFCKTVRHAIAYNMLNKRYGRGNNHNILKGVYDLMDYHWRLDNGMVNNDDK